MGIRNYIRDRKEVKAMRATEDGLGAYGDMGKALGFNSWGQRSVTQSSHVTKIPAGSKPATPKNSDWD